MLDKVNLICDCIAAICGVIPTIVTVILLVKNIIKEKNGALVKQMALEAMTAVEAYASTHPDMTSADKLDMALKAVEAGLAAAGIKIDTELTKQIIAYIEEMCKWSKTVNTVSVSECDISEAVERNAEEFEEPTDDSECL